MSAGAAVRSRAESRSHARAFERGEWWLLDRLALLISTLSGVALFLFIGRGGWYIDDFLNLGYAQESKLDSGYLTRPIFGHPEPGVRLLNWVLYRLSPMNYALAVGLFCLSLAFMCWMVYRILRLFCRPSPWMLVLTGMAGLSGLWVPVGEWWAGASEIGGCMVANVLVIHAVLRSYLGPKRLMWTGLAGVWLVVGLSFYERALAGGLFAGCFLLAVAARGFSGREIVRVVRQALATYLLLLVIAAAYLVYYISHDFVRTQPGYGRMELLHFFWTSWSSAMVTAIFGGSIRTGRNLDESFASPPVWWIAVCQLLLLAIVVHGVRTLGRRALAGWLFFIPIFLLACNAIATAKLHVHGPSVGHEYRYVADLMPLIVLTLGLTVLGPRVGRAEVSQDRPASPPGGLAVRRSLVFATVTALLAVYISSSLPASRVWVNAHTVHYVRNMQRDIRAQDAQGPYSVYTTYVPGDVSTPAYGRYSLTTRIGQLVSGHPISADDLSKPMFMFDPHGNLVPARLRTLSTVPDICATGGHQRILRKLSQPRGRYTWTVQLRYQVPAPTTLRFVADTGTRVQEATGYARSFTVSGTGRLTFQLRLLTTLTAFGLDSAQPGACVFDVRIGQPVRAS